MIEMSELQGKTNVELLSVIANLQENFSVTLQKKEKTIQAKEKTLQEKNQALHTQEKSLQGKRNYIEQLEEYIRLLKQGRFGRSSERFVDSVLQGCLFDEAELTVEQAEEAEAANEQITIPSHTRKKQPGGRKSLPEHLPRKQVIYDLADTDKVCPCGCTLTAIGEEKTDQLEIIPAQIFVVEHIQKKYACKHCEQTIKTAKKPKQPIPRSIAGPGLLAHVLTEKFEFHLPLYRQEQRLQRIGVAIPRATLSHWVINCSELLQPLVNLLEDEVREYDVAYSDETTVQVLKEPNKKAQSKSYLWVYSGGPPERFSHVCHYHPGRQHAHAIEFFEGYSGYLHCDGYAAYDALSRVNSNIKQVGCWYHARRKFVEAAKVSKKSGMAQWFIKQIQKLSKIESYCDKQVYDFEQRQAYRQAQAPALLAKFKAKLLEVKPKTPATGLLGKAIAYTLNQWPKLETYLEDGRLEISNNRTERTIKPFAVGRKNWLFANSVQGAKAAAIIFSLIETCKAHKINPYDWMEFALSKLPECEAAEEFEALLPFNCKELLSK